MKKVNLPGVAVFILCLFLHCFFSPVVQADETSIFTVSAVKPNILFILDNSNSMDEDFYGNCVTSWRTGSRSVESRRSLTNLVNTYSDQMRLGLMTFRLPGASQYQLHNAEYFLSYDPRTYCPNPPVDCSNYCYSDVTDGTCQSTCQSQNASFDATYRDLITTTAAYPANHAKRISYCDLIYPKTNALINPADPTRFIYYKTPGTDYSSTNDGNAFCYSGGYSSVDYPPYNTYDIYRVKTGTSDVVSGYSSPWFTSGFIPTDEDYALGFYNFGKRMAWQYSGRTWFANSSPGDGFLQVAVADNPSDNTQKNALLAKLTLNENNETAYMACGNTGNPNNCAYVVNAGLTPTAGTFQSAVNYLQGGSSPIQYWCQKNFVVFVTDGLPSVNESGGAGTATSLMPAVLSKITALRTLTKSLGGTAYNFNIETYVLGMGLSAAAKTQLDAMAVAGNTAVNTHAYYADNPTQLATELNNILQDIVEKTYSFSTASVASNRVSGDNFLYEAAFDPKNNQSYWPGHVIKYALGTDGSVTGIDTNWCGTSGDAAACLTSRSAGTRTMKTFKAGNFVDFNTTNIAPSDLGLGASDFTNQVATIGYIRGDLAYKTDGLKLGDVFHSNPIHIGQPSPYYDAPGFAGFRSSSTVANRPAVVIVGANDGQLHAFRASDAYELWSILPTNLLPELNAFLTTTTHHYLLDGQTSVVDANLGSTTTPDWKSLLLIGEGRGGQAERWSSSHSCDSGFSSTYSTTYPYYCGYWAFDLTDTANPAVISSSVTSTGWTYPVIKPTAANAPYLGEPWSRMTVGKVRTDSSGTDKWVAFVGGGYGSADCTGGSGCDTAEKKKGKGFYVIDLADGSVLWSYTNSNDATNMLYSFPAHPGIVDYDSDGYIDTAYIGDLGGNMWRFTFCDKAHIDANNCSTSIWTGAKLLNTTGAASDWSRPLYNYPSVTKDKAGNLWIFWATGDKSDPTNTTGTAGKVIGLKDNDRSTTYNNGDLQNVTNPSQACDNASKDGWYISFSGDEKAISDITVFGGIVYFTTYVPSSSTNPCDVSGYSNIYAINYLTCGGMLDPTNSGTLVRSMFVSYGIASAPIVSMRPGGGVGVDLYITQSGGGGQNAGTVRVSYNPPTLANKTNMLFWRDLRLQ